MRVIAGKAKGRVLVAPKGMETRPITAKIKEALFNIWQSQIVGASLFDIIYLDPPFTVDGIFMPIMEAVSSAEILAYDGIVAIRTKKEKAMPDSIGILRKFKLKNYGISCVHFYKDK